MPWSPARTHPFAHPGEAEPPPNRDIVERTRRHLLTLVPSVGEVGVERVWAGIIDVMPDAVPVLGEVPPVKGFVFATGFSGHGFCLGPGTGRAISELIVDGKASLDLHPLRYARFRENDLADVTLRI